MKLRREQSLAVPVGVPCCSRPMPIDVTCQARGHPARLDRLLVLLASPVTAISTSYADARLKPERTLTHERFLEASSLVAAVEAIADEGIDERMAGSFFGYSRNSKILIRHQLVIWRSNIRRAQSVSLVQ